MSISATGANGTNSLTRFLVPMNGADLLAKEKERRALNDDGFIVPDHVSGSEESDKGEYVPGSDSEENMSIHEDSDDAHPYATRSKGTPVQRKKRQAFADLRHKRKLGRKEQAEDKSDRAANHAEPREDPERINLKPTVLFNLGEKKDDAFSRTVIGRDKEALQIIGKLLHPSGGERPLLIGPTGIGKRSIVEKVAQLLQTTFKSSSLKNHTIRCLDATEFLASDISSKDSLTTIEKKFKSVIVHTLGIDNPPILYIRDIEKIMDGDKHNISDFLLHVLQSPFRIIASISSNKDDKVSKVVATLKAYNFSEMAIEESPEDDVCKIVKLRLQHMPVNNVIVGDDAIALGVKLAGKYVRTCPFPNKAMNLIHESSIRVLMDRLAQQADQSEPIVITPRHIAEAVSSMTSISAEDLLDNVLFNEERFYAKLNTLLVGQEHALALVSDLVARWKMNLTADQKPWGVLLFIGPTGTGKTELAKLLARFLYDDEKNLVRIDGSEYGEKHSMARLIGAPPGYEGHENGGQLTDVLKRNRHMVVLFDEYEKAHPDVRKVFLQVFDAGRLTDARGITVDCRDTLFIMTSNLGSKELFDLCKKDSMDLTKVMETLTPLLTKEYSPELCNRFDAFVPFQPMSKEHLPRVIEVNLGKVAERIQKNAKIQVHWNSGIVEFFVKQSFDPRFGMRKVCRDMDTTIQQAIKAEAKRQECLLQGPVVCHIVNDEIRVHPVGIFLMRLAEKLHATAQINLFWTKELLEHFISEAKQGTFLDIEKVIQQFLGEEAKRLGRPLQGEVKLTFKNKKIALKTQAKE